MPWEAVGEILVGRVDLQAFWVRGPVFLLMVLAKKCLRPADQYFGNRCGFDMNQLMLDLSTLHWGPGISQSSGVHAWQQACVHLHMMSISP